MTRRKKSQSLSSTSMSESYYSSRTSSSSSSCDDIQSLKAKLAFEKAERKKAEAMALAEKTRREMIEAKEFNMKRAEKKKKKKQQEEDKVVQDEIFYSAASDDLTLFHSLEDKIRLALSKAGYVIAKCETNLRFYDPMIDIEAYNYKTQSYLHGNCKIEPSQRGYNYDGTPKMKYLRIRMQY